jgi:hypothetical protein
MNKENPLSAITQILSIIASIFIIINVIRKEYPTWLLYIAVGLIIIISIISIYPKIKSYILSKLEIRRKNRLIQKKFPEFEDLVERFSKYMENSQCENIPSIFEELKNSDPEFKKIIISPIHNLTTLFYDFKGFLKSLKKKRENFVLLVKIFYRILIIYNNECVCSPIQRIKDMRKEIPVPYIERYKQYRNEYLLFLAELKKFGEKIKEEFKEPIATHFEFPKEL